MSDFCFILFLIIMIKIVMIDGKNQKMKELVIKKEHLEKVLGKYF